MVIAGHEWMHDIPFRDVYFTGIVRDKLGRKMSKSLGNSPDLLALIDQYGADAVRFGIMIASPQETTFYLMNHLWNRAGISTIRCGMH